jgi:hypothetical protein
MARHFIPSEKLDRLLVLVSCFFLVKKPYFFGMGLNQVSMFDIKAPPE